MINFFSDISIHVSPEFYRKAFPPAPSSPLNIPDRKLSGIDVFINNNLPQEIKQEVKNDGRFLFMRNNRIKVRKPGKRKPFTLSVKTSFHALIYDLKNKYEYAMMTGLIPSAPPPPET
jgi:hypothetical protein